MKEKISKAFTAPDLHDKNINFLIGSGASASYMPTLEICKDITYEYVLTTNTDNTTENLIYYQYYKNILEKSFCLIPSDNEAESKYSGTLKSYKILIESIVNLINKKSANQIRRANIFTTNYDFFFEKASDSLLSESVNFIFNDGARGLDKRYLQISNFHTSTWHQGTNDLYKFEIPTINLIKIHGSVSWKKMSDHKIEVSYPKDYPQELKVSLEVPSIKEIVGFINKSPEETIEKTLKLSNKTKSKLENFRKEYDKLAIVNPTKAKFEETVFQQHYYQSLRLLSYELEKPQTVLICFGFSFGDEHIREIISRALSNPALMIYIFCYKSKDKPVIKGLIHNKKFFFIYPDNEQDFIDINKFIECIFFSDDEARMRGLICSL